MKNFSDELLHQKLTAAQHAMAGASSRAAWWKARVVEGLRKANAVGGPDDSPALSGSPEDDLSEEELLAQSKVAHFGQVLPIEDVDQVLDLADSITRLPCGCRLKTTGKADTRYCFGFAVDKLGIMGIYPDASSSLEVLDKHDAKRIFHRYDQEGLIHSIWTRGTPYISGLCNCDHDCLIYRRQFKEGGASWVLQSRIRVPNRLGTLHRL
jgi:hypothetical protein